MKAPRDKKLHPGRGWMYHTIGAAKIALFIAAFKFIEVLIVPPPVDEPRWLVAAVMSFNYWGAGVALGAAASLGRVSHRLFGWPAFPAPSAVRLTRQVVPTAEVRLRMLGFNVVAGWFVLAAMALLMMADTRSGPFARAALGLFGPNALIGLETFVLGLSVLVAPLVLLALLPWQTRFPLLASMQAVVKPAEKASARRRKRP